MFNFFPQSKKGALLMQLLVSIGIIVMLSLISIPFIRQYQPKLILNGTAKELISDLRYTQQLTVSEQEVYYLEMDQINSRYAIYKQSDPADPIKNVELDPTVSYQSITDLTDDKVIYNSFGAVSEAGQIVLINSNGQTAAIDVRPSGYIQWHQ
ncbi:MAG: hypothetical protein Q8Q23_03730 [bacterium]|nr:hypothetical protein [bacterium]